jgi:hypothetical protein
MDVIEYVAEQVRRQRHGIEALEGIERIGIKSCAPPEEVKVRLVRLFKFRDEMTPLEFYKEFETVHPFVDGNGRVGKVLYCWLLGELLNLSFPPPLWEAEMSSPDSRSANQHYSTSSGNSALLPTGFSC